MTDGVEIVSPDVDRWGETVFVPGGHVGLVAESTVALIEAGHGSTRERLWKLVAADAAIDDVLDELSATGLKALPSFALAQVDGVVLRLVARGAMRVTVTFTDGSVQVVDPSDVRTWREDVFVDVARGVLGFDAAESSSAESDRFFVLAGSVPASSLERRFDAADQLAATAAAAWKPARPPVQSTAGSMIHQDLGPPSSAVDDEESSLSDPPEMERVDELESFIDEQGDGDQQFQDSDVEDQPAAPENLQPVGGEAPPEDSNETISSIDFSEPIGPPADATTPPRGEPEVAADAEDGDNYDFIYGHTVARSVEGAAVRADEVSGGDGLISSVPGDGDASSGVGHESGAGLAGDHDGLTISRADLAAMKASSDLPVQGSGNEAGHDEVLAVMCGDGHPNAPHAANCRVCGVVIATSSPVSIRRPPLGILVFSNGERVVADRTVLIGRNPRVSGTLTGEFPGS